jgi:hypothetical protein
MTLRNSQMHTYKMLGLSDAIDGDAGFPGGMLNLQNLIPDPQGQGMWVCRPAAAQQTSFAGFTSPGFVSVFKVIGTKIYGLVQTGRNAGHEEPFAYDTATGLFTTISGVTSANTPLNAPASGTWTPPTCDLVGSKVIFTHPGFNAGGGFFIGVLDVTNPVAPTWTAGNLTGLISFTTLPVAVQQFNGRAWYAVGNSIVFSDTTSPTNCTLGTQVLTIGTNLNFVALIGLPLSAPLTGGIVQALVAFVDSTYVYQITGDAALSNLAMNQNFVATGTLSQNSVCTTPSGLCFVAPDGIRFMDYNGVISEPLTNDGKGVNLPFFSVLVPTRVCIAYANDVVRVSLQNGLVPGSPSQEYFFHLSKKRWSGPHTFPSSLVQGIGTTFVKTPIGVNGSLWLSSATPGLTNTYTENSSPMQWQISSPLIPTEDSMSEWALQEMTINIALNNMDIYTFGFTDEQSAFLNSQTLVGLGSPTVWGAFTWGSALWQGVSQAYSSKRLDFNAPVVFKRTYFTGFGASSGAFKIGDFNIMAERLGYTQPYGT